MTAPAANVFISYSHHDAPLVAPVVSLLRVSRALVFRDADSIPPGKKWRGEIETAIDNAHVLVVFWCYHALDSDEVAIEYRRAISQGKDVVPLRLDDSPLPPELNDFQFIDFRAIPGFRHGAEISIDATTNEASGRSATATTAGPEPSSTAPTPTPMSRPSIIRRIGSGVYAGIAVLVAVLATLGILSTQDFESPPVMDEPSMAPVPQVPSAEFASVSFSPTATLLGLALVVGALWVAWRLLQYLLHRYREPTVPAEVPLEPDRRILHAQRKMAATIESAVLERIKGHPSKG